MLTVIAMLGSSSCAVDGNFGPGATRHGETETSRPVPTVSASEASTLLAALPRQERSVGSDGYSRDAFGQAWKDIDDNGCNQRDDVLLRDAVPGSTQVQQQGPCDHDVLAGTWLDPYSGARLVFTDLKDLRQAQAIRSITSSRSPRHGCQARRRGVQRAGSGTPTTRQTWLRRAVRSTRARAPTTQPHGGPSRRTNARMRPAGSRSSTAGTLQSIPARSERWKTCSVPVPNDRITAYAEAQGLELCARCSAKDVGVLSGFRGLLRSCLNHRVEVLGACRSPVSSFDG